MSAPKPSLDSLRIERKDKPRSTSRISVAVLIAVVCLLGRGLAWHFRAGKVVQVRTAVARTVSTSNEGRTVLNASGYVTARRQATASSKVTGKVVEVLIEEGVEGREGH